MDRWTMREVPLSYDVPLWVKAGSLTLFAIFMAAFVFGTSSPPSPQHTPRSDVSTATQPH